MTAGAASTPPNDRKREIHAHLASILTSHADKAKQATERPSLRGWFFGKLMIATGGRDADLARQVVDEHFAQCDEWPVFVFRRESVWYPVALPSVYDVPANVACNPGTLSVEDAAGNVIWPIGAPR